MIAHLKGILLRKAPQSLIIENGGIGYEVITPLSTFYALPGETEPVSLHIYTHVREDAFLLYGFHTLLEKEIFQMLISVSGIGPKLAVNILSGIGPEQLLEAIARGDAIRLQSIPGIGRKTSERIALELKEKALKVTADLKIPTAPVRPDVDQGVLDDALSALLYLGYPSKSARSAVNKSVALLKEINLEGVIKEALRLLA